MDTLVLSVRSMECMLFWATRVLYDFVFGVLTILYENLQYRAKQSMIRTNHSARPIPLTWTSVFMLTQFMHTQIKVCKLFKRVRRMNVVADTARA